MKTIFLSFTPAPFYDPIKDGLKRYEYRSRFRDEECYAYLYLSAPVQQVVAKIKFGKRIELETWKKQFADQGEAMKRLHDFIAKGNRYAIPILEFQEINRVPISKLKEAFPDFRSPRSYLILDKLPKVLDCLNNVQPIGKKLVHDLSVVEPWEVCIY
jgi:predicted transcriptional regulator